jgi:hypothetical protein
MKSSMCLQILLTVGKLGSNSVFLLGVSKHKRMRKETISLWKFVILEQFVHWQQTFINDFKLKTFDVATTTTEFFYL